MDVPLAVVAAWHDALNAGDGERLAALSHPEVEVAGPRGIGRGVDILREWVERAGIRLDPERWFGRGDALVVLQRATWRSPETGEPGEPQMVATAFRIGNGRVRRVARFERLDEALADADLDTSAELPMGAAES